MQRALMEGLKEKWGGFRGQSKRGGFGGQRKSGEAHRKIASGKWMVIDQMASGVMGGRRCGWAGVGGELEGAAPK